MGGMHKRFSDSLRKLVLSGNSQDSSIDSKNFNSTKNNTGSWGSMDEYNTDESDTEYNRCRSESDSLVTLFEKKSAAGSENMLPYYKFAHVKRSAVLPDVRYEPERQNECSSIRIAEKTENPVLHNSRLSTGNGIGIHQPESDISQVLVVD